MKHSKKLTSLVFVTILGAYALYPDISHAQQAERSEGAELSAKANVAQEKGQALQSIIDEFKPEQDKVEKELAQKELWLSNPNASYPRVKAVTIAQLEDSDVSLRCALAETKGKLRGCQNSIRDAASSRTRLFDDLNTWERTSQEIQNVPSENDGQYQCMIAELVDKKLQLQDDLERNIKALRSNNATLHKWQALTKRDWVSELEHERRLAFKKSLGYQNLLGQLQTRAEEFYRKADDLQIQAQYNFKKADKKEKDNIERAASPGRDEAKGKIEDIYNRSKNEDNDKRAVDCQDIEDIIEKRPNDLDTIGYGLKRIHDIQMLMEQLRADNSSKSSTVSVTQINQNNH